MKFSSSRIPAAEHHVPLLLLLLVAPAIAQLDCKKIVADGFKFDLGELKGAHTVLTTDKTPPTVQNTTYTVSICGPVKRVKDAPKVDKCPNGAWICALEHTTSHGTTVLSKVLPIAGNMPDAGLGKLEPMPTRLSGSDSHSDNEKVGLRLVMQGGRWHGRKQKAIIEFLCDPDKTGREGEMAPPEGDEYEDQAASEAEGRRKREEGDEKKEKSGQQQVAKDGAALVWNSYGAEKDEDVLRLTWHTKFACESNQDGGNPNASSHWGFFTWFVLLVFFGTASYLLFGSWINYNRYGARGWDLIPHGDMIRDIPYLLKDWIRRLINTLQGSGSRGGYSAV